MDTDSIEEPPLISVVIVNWNSLSFLERCLETVFADDSVPRLDVIVVDGGSFDGSDQFLADQYPKQVRFIQADNNIGFARSNNLALPYIRGQYLALLNPDTEIIHGTWVELIETHKKLENPGILGPKLLNTDGSHQKSGVQALPTPLNQIFDSNILRRLFPRSRLWGTYEAYRSERPLSVQALSGAFMFMKSSTFRAVNGFDESYFMYAEDMDLSKRIHDSGKLNYYVPKVSTVHHGGGSSSTAPSDFSTKAMCVSLHHFMARHYGQASANRYKIGMKTSSIVRLSFLNLAIFLFPKENVISTKLFNSIQKWNTILKWSRVSQSKL